MPSDIERIVILQILPNNPSKQNRVSPNQSKSKIRKGKKNRKGVPSIPSNIKNSFLESLVEPSSKEKNSTLLFDYIVPICNANSTEYVYRKKAIQTLVNHLPSYVHLILVEQVITHKNKRFVAEIIFPHYLNKTVITVKNNQFNKPWLNNIGAKHSKTQNLLFAESDIVIDESYFRSFYKHVEGVKPKWCMGWNRLIYWNKDEKTINRVYYKNKDAQGGVVYFKKNFFIKLGGFNESFVSLGGIDNEIYIRAYALCRPKDASLLIHHMWHPQSLMKKSRERKTNKMFYFKTKANPKSVNNILSKNWGRLGNKSTPITSLFNHWKQPYRKQTNPNPKPQGIRR